MIRFKNIVSYLGSIQKTIQPAANIEFLQYYNLLIGVINFTFTVSNGCDQFCQFILKVFLRRKIAAHGSQVEYNIAIHR